MLRLRYNPGDVAPRTSDSEADAAPGPVIAKPKTCTMETQTAVGYAKNFLPEESIDPDERGRPVGRSEHPEERSSGDKPSSSKTAAP